MSDSVLNTPQSNRCNDFFHGCGFVGVIVVLGINENIGLDVLFTELLSLLWHLYICVSYLDFEFEPTIV